MWLAISLNDGNVDMKMGINKTTVLSPEIKAAADQISDAFGELPWEFKQQQEYNWISHFQLKCWKAKERQNGRSIKVRHENFPNSKVPCLYCWNFMKAMHVWSGLRIIAGREVEILLACWGAARSPLLQSPILRSPRGGWDLCFSPSGFCPAGLSSFWAKVTSPQPLAAASLWNKGCGVEKLGCYPAHSSKCYRNKTRVHTLKSVLKTGHYFLLVSLLSLREQTRGHLSDTWSCHWWWLLLSQMEPGWGGEGGGK